MSKSRVVPAINIAIERGHTVKHTFHIGTSCYVPATDITIESSADREHTFKTRDKREVRGILCTTVET